ncbi:MAG: hypothetical protein HC788_14865, partial [Sphingopyxis sp.]|nr:hypothetical protein [Sphingopyxis sp.]
SHSAAYALLAYQSAWLKANHPAAFMAATMTSELADSGRIATLVEECRRMKLTLLPPDVNRSEWGFGIEDGGGKGDHGHGAAALSCSHQGAKSPLRGRWPMLS